jgi:hypothetical protein
MKEIILFLAGVLVSRVLMAQTFAEWFRQNQTQLDYLGKQIAALAGYGSVLQKGYSVAGTGLEVIGDIDDADYDQHSGYFASLEMAKPDVADDWRIEGIAKYSGLLSSVAGDIEAYADLQPPGDEVARGLCLAVAAHIRQELLLDGDLLEKVIQEGWFEMDDDARLAVIGAMYDELKGLYVKSVYLLCEFELRATKVII